MARGRTKRKVDTWKTKRWFDIYAPKMFNEIKIGETVASDPDRLIGRVVEVTLKDLTGDFTKQYIKLRFQIDEVKGDKAYTKFKGLLLSREYMRSQIRRKTTRVEGIFDAVTKSGEKLRVRTIAIARGRSQTSQERAIRKAMVEVVKKRIENSTLEEFIEQVLNGSISKEMHDVAHKICPLKNVDIRKIKVL
ncbi:MAG: 30S ribosomal protein S3ae [Thermoplasmata archaeon]|nr:MAG: 30S ribosomal protein S3ae [Thermoplasmata archaeon]